jgi:hypothetical protein
MRRSFVLDFECCLWGGCFTYSTSEIVSYSLWTSLIALVSIAHSIPLESRVAVRPVWFIWSINTSLNTWPHSKIAALYDVSIYERVSLWGMNHPRRLTRPCGPYLDRPCGVTPPHSWLFMCVWSWITTSLIEFSAFVDVCPKFATELIPATDIVA